VPPIIGLSTSWQIGQIIWMGVCNEIIFKFINFVFVILILVFIFINFGFYIEELITAFATALSAMTLSI